MSDVTISKYYNYKHLKPYIGLEGSIPVKHKDVFVGVELELEEVTSNQHYKLSSFNVTEDHSLKLDGLEFVTVPIKMRYLEVELRRIFGALKNSSVSARCSTHVHMNVRDMTVKEIINLVILYMVFERGLYRISGDRWDSNFCVPLNMSHKMIHQFFKVWDNPLNWGWHKYTGLNISPIWGGEDHTDKGRIGTVEFRQLRGSTDVEEIMQWCNIITALKRAAQEMPLDETIAHIRTMNTTSGYYWLAKEIFGKYAKLLTHQSTFAEDTEKCIANIKFLIPDNRLGYSTKKEIKKKEDKPIEWLDGDGVPIPSDTPTITASDIQKMKEAFDTLYNKPMWVTATTTASDAFFSYTPIQPPLKKGTQ